MSVENTVKCPVCGDNRYIPLLHSEVCESGMKVCWDCLEDSMKRYYELKWFPLKEYKSVFVISS